MKPVHSSRHYYFKAKELPHRVVAWPAPALKLPYTEVIVVTIENEGMLAFCCSLHGYQKLPVTPEMNDIDILAAFGLLAAPGQRVIALTRNADLDAAIERYQGMGYDLDIDYARRLASGFARPNGSLFWSWYLSELTEDAKQFVRDWMLVTDEAWMLDSQYAGLAMFRRIYRLIKNGDYVYRDYPPKWQRRAKKALAGCRIVDCGVEESRCYMSFEGACRQIVSSENAKKRARPDLLAPLLQEYIDVLVEANNAVICHWNGKESDQTSPLELSKLRAHPYSEKALQQIAESPIAAIFLTQYYDLGALPVEKA